MSNINETNEKTFSFVQYVTEFVKNGNKKVLTDLKYACHPNLSYRAWKYLINFIDIEEDKERTAYSLIGASIAKNKITADGTESIGSALIKSCNKDNPETAQTKLMRLLACSDYKELCEILKYHIQFIEEKGQCSLSYSKLLKDIIYFGEKIKTKWASDFYKGYYLNQEKQDVSD